MGEILTELETRKKYNRLDETFPDTGVFRRELYPKHIEFMQRGAHHTQRAFIAGNRCGKTLTSCVELTYHLTGKYPKWWEGKRFFEPTSCWAMGINSQQVKEGLQVTLLGPLMDKGTGTIPREDIIKVTMKPGAGEAVETIYIKHRNRLGDEDGISELTFKSYEQGRDSLQGSRKSVILLDEEPPSVGIFTECLTRLAGDGQRIKDGILMFTFTPLRGLSDVVLGFYPGGKPPSYGTPPDAPYRYVTSVTWDDVPHLTEEFKKEALASYPAHERLARSKGIPSLGAGAIYPYPEEELIVKPFPIPSWFKRCYGMDVGWNKTAVLWVAFDPDAGIYYIYSEYYAGQAVPAVHASAIKARGNWILGAVDPRSDARSQADGTRLVDLYLQEGLKITPADNSVEAGLYKISQLLEAGRIKVFDTCENWLTEFRIYRRDETGKIIKQHDHLMDAMRYAFVTGTELMTAIPDPDATSRRSRSSTGRNDVTGY